MRFAQAYRSSKLAECLAEKEKSMCVEVVRLYGKQRRNRHPLEAMPDDWLLERHDYFVDTPPESAAEGMNLDGVMIGPPLTPETLERLIPSRRLVEDEMKKRGLLVDS